MSGPEMPTPASGLDAPAVGRRAFLATGVVFGLTVVAGFLPYEHHPHFPFEEVPGFAAMFGLTGCIGLVLGAVGLRGWLMREEDHYRDE